MRSLCRLPLHEHQPLHLPSQMVFRWQRTRWSLCRVPLTFLASPLPRKGALRYSQGVADVVEEMTASGESIPLWFTETLQPKPPNKA